MDYVKEIRALVGSRPLLLAGVAVLILNEEGQLLMQHRADTRDWGLPAGYMEIGEKPDEAAKREVREETGLAVRKLELVDLFGGKENYILYPNGDEVYSLTAIYQCKEYDGSIQMDEESLALSFFPIR
ncbi:NUDIX hydrolase [Paenibacillus turpanensis]|uniref:NUDIX hydrolase n=1 Tax=Paenibacillus turpanensis TaxID=2689078 RepID=UPI00140A52D1|nr:NUDIX domain-containing protein [Paenibacillus turpanensis]